MIKDQESLDELKQAAKVLKSGQSSALKTLSDKLEELSANIEGKHAEELEAARVSNEQFKKRTQLWKGASLSLFIVSLLLGLVVLIPLRSPSTPQPGMVITSPQDEDAVEMTIPVAGTVAKLPMIQGRKLYVFVRPHGLHDQDAPFDYWVQPQPDINSDGTWRAWPVGVGQESDHGRSFEICAVLTSQTLTSPNSSALPPGPASCNTVTRK